MLSVREIDDRQSWNDRLRELPGAHVLQTWEWGDFKQSSTGWRCQRLAFHRGAQVQALASLARRRIGPLQVLAVSKGPVLDYANLELAGAVFHELERRARRAGTVWLKCDPDIAAATGLPGSADDQASTVGQALLHMLQARGWRFSPTQVQFRNSMVIDLRQSEAELLAGMNASTRRKLRLAVKRGLSIRPASVDDLPLLYALYAETAQRDQFLIRPFHYYRLAWQRFLEAGLAQAFIAECAGRAIAHVILFHFGRDCWYFYGASSNSERHCMPNHALQWHAMQWAQAQGYTRYDMWGAPDVFDESDRLWGVYQFKRGFGGQILRHVGAWDYIPQPWLYRAYEAAMPRWQHLLRRRARQTGTAP